MLTVIEKYFLYEYGLKIGKLRYPIQYIFIISVTNYHKPILTDTMNCNC